MQTDTLLSVELPDSLFNEISEMVKRCYGINLHDGKKELVKARLTKRLRLLHLRDFHEYIRYLQSDSDGTELVAMIDALSTNLTSFFRENDHFEFVSSSLIPQWRSDSAGTGRELRIWSAGCSSGEEPYSIAMVLGEGIPDLSSWDAKILATDISTRILARAKEGVYSDERLKGISPKIKMKYFDSEGRGASRSYHIKQELRHMVHFARLNLMGSWPMKGSFDAIFCRNVMIYFDKPTQERLVQRYWQMLRPGGVLFVGHSESLTGVKHQFHYVQPTIYRR